jgi:hypothetical protein
VCIIIYSYFIVFIFWRIHIQRKPAKPYRIHAYLDIFKINFSVSYFWPALVTRIDTEISSNCDRKQGAAVAHTLWPSCTLPGRFGDGLCWHGVRDAVEPESGDGVRGKLAEVRYSTFLLLRPWLWVCELWFSTPWRAPRHMILSPHSPYTVVGP